MESFKCESVLALHDMPAEYRVAVEKIVISHVVNELYGAQVFDEPAIGLAPTPYTKWLACRIAMEEYHHHLLFKALADSLEIVPERINNKQPLSIFSFPLKTWTEFCVIKLLADAAESLLIEELMQCSFVPLQQISREMFAEERFHAQFGEDACAEIIQTTQGRKEVQQVINAYYPLLITFFGAAHSINNELFLRFGLKSRTNTEIRALFIKQMSQLLHEKYDLRLPCAV